MLATTMEGNGQDLIAPGRTAVVTGAASGIGFALATRFLAEGMNVVLADIERGALDEAIAQVDTRARERVLARVVDVSDATAVQTMADEAVQRFGAPHVVCANAGVGSRGLSIADLPLDDFRWVLGVNLFGVIHTLKAFLPSMRAANRGHLVATSSAAGLLPPPMMGPYSASKAGVIALCESLWQELQMEGSEIGVTVLCPSFVKTNLPNADRNMPAPLAAAFTSEQTPALEQRRHRMLQLTAQIGMEPSEVADLVANAVRERRFYLLTHPDETLAGVTARYQRIVEGSRPAAVEH